MIETSNAIYKGLFWVVCSFENNDFEIDFENSRIILYKVPCDETGLVADVNKWMLHSNDRKSANHKATWEKYVKDIAPGLTDIFWNFFPRGRVEINAGKAIIFFHPVLKNLPDFELKITTEFGLDNPLIKSVKLVADESKHYEFG